MTYLIAGLVVGYFVLWFVFEWWEKRQAAAGRTRISALRRVFAVFGALTALFSGGCGLAIGIAEALRTRSGAADDFMSVDLAVIVSLPPFLIGALLWWLFMRRPRG